VLSVTAIVHPDRWTETFHHLPYIDPAACSAAPAPSGSPSRSSRPSLCFRWQKQPYWLPLIAGVRFTELFSDWVTIIAARR